jgi:hypothetical protein
MKKLLLLTLITIVFISCSEKNPISDQIEQEINENAMGADLDYKPIETVKVDEVHYQDFLEIFKIQADIEGSEESIDTILVKVERGMESLKKQNKADTFNYMKFQKKRLQQYKNANNKNDVAYTIYHHKYSIINPMFNDVKVEVNNYYFFDNKQKLMFSIDDSEFKEIKNDYIQHDKIAYEYMLFDGEYDFL